MKTLALLLALLVLASGCCWTKDCRDKRAHSFARVVVNDCPNWPFYCGDCTPEGCLYGH